MKAKWYNLKNLAYKKFNDIQTDVAGIYFVRWARNGKPVSIPRLRGTDHKGILYIGSAKKLKRRIRQLWKGINLEVANHTIGKTIIFCKVFEIVNLVEYEISWEELKTVDDARAQEWAAVRSYADTYKEPPPLNLGIRREFFAVGGIFKAGKFRVAHKPDRFVRSIIN